MNVRIVITVISVMFYLGCGAGNIKNTNSGFGYITVLPEQETYVEVVIVNGSVSEVNRVSGGGNVSFNLSDMANGMMLSGKNGLDYTIKYDIYMVDFNGKKHYTSSCPLMPGVGAFESWPHKIPRMSLENFRVIPSDGNMACR